MKYNSKFRIKFKRISLKEIFQYNGMIYAVACSSFTPLIEFYCKILHEPDPIGVFLEGYRGAQAPYDVDTEIYEVIYSSSAEEQLAHGIQIISFILTIISILFLLFVTGFIRRYMLEPLYDKIWKLNINNDLKRWLQTAISGSLILLYLLFIRFLIWFSLGI